MTRGAMFPALVLTLGLVSGARLIAADQPDTCSACHAAQSDARLKAPVTLFADDIHRARGFGCTACHGGDPREPGLESMNPAKGYIGVPARGITPQVCARCHADAEFMRRYNPALRVDQLAEYETSVHGRRLRGEGDPKVATCASCHTPHSIRPASDARSTVHPLRVVDTCGRCHGDAALMASYGIPTDQPAKYKASVHWQKLTVGGDLSAPTCNDCHGNHGAAPPGVNWVGNVCGQCHSVMAERFALSRHATAFAEMGTPGCATCHGNHDVLEGNDRMLGTGEGAFCGTCHAADDPGGKAAEGMRALLDRLLRAHDDSLALLMRAERSGMEVSQARFDLTGAADALVKARADLHSFNPAIVQKTVAEGIAITERTQARGVRALEELAFRRKGLAVSLLLIGAVIGGLVLKIREIERRQDRERT
jgi:Cytochrome c3